MDAYLAVVSKREVRSYDARPIERTRSGGSSRPGGSRAARRTASRGASSSLRDPALVQRAAACVYAPDNVLGAALVVAVVVGGKGPTAFDAGRAAQNMMLAASNEGIGSCPNGIADAAALQEVVGHDDGEQVATVLTFGYPGHAARPRAAVAPTSGSRAPTASRTRTSSRSADGARPSRALCRSARDFATKHPHPADFGGPDVRSRGVLVVALWLLLVRAVLSAHADARAALLALLTCRRRVPCAPVARSVCRRRTVGRGCGPSTGRSRGSRSARTRTPAAGIAASTSRPRAARPFAARAPDA